MIPSVIIVDNEMNYTFYTLPYWGEQQWVNYYFWKLSGR
jgi:hypothetical protein